MSITVMISEDVVREALARSKRRSDGVPTSDALNTVPDKEQEIWIQRVWNAAEEAVVTAMRTGMSTAHQWIEKVESLLMQISKEVEQVNEAVGAEVLRRLHATLRDLVEQCIERCIVSVKIEGVTAKISEVTVGHTVKLSGSVSASLSKLCEFVADGTLSVTVKYVSAGKPSDTL
jgi:hypothetical protein